jgi:hypothetical protein
MTQKILGFAVFVVLAITLLSSIFFTTGASIKFTLPGNDVTTEFPGHQ